MPVLKNIQRGQVELTSTSVNVSVTAYNLSRSVLLFAYRGGGNQAQWANVEGRKSSTTQLTFTRLSAAGGTAPIIEWQLLEFDADVSVQDLQVVDTDPLDYDITISSVNVSESFVVTLGNNAAGTTWGSNDSVRWSLVGATTCNAFRNGGGITFTSRAQVVSYSTASVQRFSRDNQSADFSQPISTVTEAKSFTLGTGSSRANFGADRLYRLTIVSGGGSIYGQPYTTGVAWDLHVEVVSLTQSEVTQSIRANLASGNASFDYTITASKILDSSVFMSGCSDWGLTHACCADTDDDTLESFVTLLQTTATNVQMQRAASGSELQHRFSVVKWHTETTAIVYDNASRSSRGSGVGPLTWSHSIGSGADRILIVGVTMRGNNESETTPSAVTYNGVAMTPVSGGSRWQSPNRMTLYYLLNASLPSTGSYTVSVTAPSSSTQATIAGATSLRAVRQQAPEVVATGAVGSALRGWQLAITPATSEAWIVEFSSADGADTAQVFGTGMTERHDHSNSGSSQYGSTRPVGRASESYRAGWYTDNFSANSVAVVAVSLAPVVSLFESNAPLFGCNF